MLVFFAATPMPEPEFNLHKINKHVILYEIYDSLDALII